MWKSNLAGSGKILRQCLKEIAFYERLQKFGIIWVEGAERVSIYKKLIPLLHDYLYRA